MNATLSVCVLTYNHENYIEQSMGSILQQEYPFSLEIIVADDASSDRTQDILRDNYSEVAKLILRSENVGTVRNVEGAYAHVTGKYCMLFDGDDYWYPNAKILNEMIEILEENDQYVAVSAHRDIVDENGSVLVKREYGNRSNDIMTLQRFVGNENYDTCTTIVRSDVVKTFDFEIAKCASRNVEDLTICMMILLQGNVLMIPKTIGAYRSVSKTGSNNYNSMLNYWDSYSEHICMLDFLKQQLNIQFSMNKRYIFYTVKVLYHICYNRKRKQYFGQILSRTNLYIFICSYCEYLLKRLRERSIGLYRRFKNYKMERFLKESRKCYGTRHIGKTFYVIRSRLSNVGLMTYHNYILRHIEYAIQHNYIPVIDMKHYPSMYHEKNEINTVNVWEYYFKQPMGYSLEEVYRSFNVILSEAMPITEQTQINSVEDIGSCNEIITKYMQLNTETAQKLEKKIQEFRSFCGDKKVLGICCRGTDYTTLKPTGHVIPITSTETIKLAQDKLKEWSNYDRIYLATEDQAIYEEFRNIFKERLYALECERYESDTHNRKLADISFDREKDRYLKGLEYLLTVYLLAECNSIITPDIASGLAAVRLNSNEYEHKIIVGHGVYE